MDPFMKRAVELAVNNVRDGGQPFGAVLVKDNKVTAEGVNELHKTYDISGHAEMLAIRKAQKELRTHDLSDYTMYASGEPCPMCLTVMYFAGIKKVYYCQSVEDAVAAGLGKSQIIYKELGKRKEDRKLKMVQMGLKDEQTDPMNLWKKNNDL
ncbi:nucleoside deaminase [Oceanobacillus salinisoli]|uniref:nucleoside deaminase n=1 Tax=Oceanobacillus salinisoli TaxID=2678611 RepID=UPI0012E17408|nr:nucleoside deaminase [Oceanobacillus salinisoli]